MTFSSGYTGVLKINGIDIRNITRSANIKRGHKQLTVTSLADTDDAFMSGRGNKSGSIVVYVDTTNPGFNALVDAEDSGSPVEIDMGPSTLLHWKGNAILSLSYNNSGDENIITFDWTGSGSWSKLTS